MTEPVMAEVPKPRRLYGVKAEVAICPPSAAIGKAVKPATALIELRMSLPKVSPESTRPGKSRTGEPRSSRAA
jgi:hypothetical protein